MKSQFSGLTEYYFLFWKEEDNPCWKVTHVVIASNVRNQIRSERRHATDTITEEKRRVWGAEGVGEGWVCSAPAVQRSHPFSELQENTC